MCVDGISRFEIQPEHFEDFRLEHRAVQLLHSGTDQESHPGTARACWGTALWMEDFMVSQMCFKGVLKFFQLYLSSVSRRFQRVIKRFQGFSELYGLNQHDPTFFNAECLKIRVKECALNRPVLLWVQILLDSIFTTITRQIPEAVLVQARSKLLLVKHLIKKS